ncbi:MAG: hypothetical protein V3S30_09835 [Thermoanaerobaculia bacterium]
MANEMVKLTQDDILRIFNAREPTDEEWEPIANAIAARIADEIDQQFKDEVDEMIQRPKPMMPLTGQKHVTLLRDAIRVCEAKGQDTSDLREDLAYLEDKYRGQPREG